MCNETVANTLKSDPLSSKDWRNTLKKLFLVILFILLIKIVLQFQIILKKLTYQMTTSETNSI